MEGLAQEGMRTPPPSLYCVSWRGSEVDRQKEGAEEELIDVGRNALRWSPRRGSWGGEGRWIAPPNALRDGMSGYHG